MPVSISGVYKRRRIYTPPRSMSDKLLQVPYQPLFFHYSDMKDAPRSIDWKKFLHLLPDTTGTALHALLLGNRN